MLNRRLSVVFSSGLSLPLIYKHLETYLSTLSTKVNKFRGKSDIDTLHKKTIFDLTSSLAHLTAKSL